MKTRSLVKPFGCWLLAAVANRSQGENFVRMHGQSTPA